MATYQRIFAMPSVAQTHVHFGEVLAIAQLLDRERATIGQSALAAATRREVLRAYERFNRELDAAAVRAAADAKQAIIARLKATAKRPDTRLGPHLRGAIRCRPLRRFGALATGEVGVADEEALDKVVNPFAPQAGPYWRAQEEGTAAHVGRVIRGYFYGPGLSGTPTRPLAQYAGGGGPHPIFVPASAMLGARGGAGGFGTIRHPIQARHFIRDGADQAEARWRASVRGIDSRTARSLGRLLGP